MPQTPPTLDDLDAHSRQHLAAYKTPAPGARRRDRPLASGKPDYPWATALAQEALAATTDA
jgi:hypothetical protein